MSEIGSVDVSFPEHEVVIEVLSRPGRLVCVGIQRTDGGAITGKWLRTLPIRQLLKKSGVSVVPYTRQRKVRQEPGPPSAFPELQLSQRVENCLLRAGILTTQHLLSLGEEELLAFVREGMRRHYCTDYELLGGFGPKAQAEVREARLTFLKGMAAVAA